MSTEWFIGAPLLRGQQAIPGLLSQLRHGCNMSKDIAFVLPFLALAITTGVCAGLAAWGLTANDVFSYYAGMGVTWLCFTFGWAIYVSRHVHSR